MSNEQPSFYAIIPANVRYDKSLKPNAKLLYGELTALSNLKGYCWSSNKYFAELYGVTNSAISKWISQLKDKGYIEVKMIREPGSKVIKERHIYINEGVVKKDTTGIVQKEVGVLPNVQDPIGQMCSDNNTLINNTINNTKDKSEKSPPASKVKYLETDKVYLLSKYLYSQVLKNDPSAKEPNFQTWSNTMRLINESDKRSFEDIRDVITFATTISYRKSNILSPTSLRKAFSSLYIDYNEYKNKNGQKKYQQPTPQVTSKEVIKSQPDHNGFDGTNLNEDMLLKGIDKDTLLTYYNIQLNVTGKQFVYDRKPMTYEEFKNFIEFI